MDNMKLSAVKCINNSEINDIGENYGINDYDDVARVFADMSVFSKYLASPGMSYCTTESEREFLQHVSESCAYFCKKFVDLYLSE